MSRIIPPALRIGENGFLDDILALAGDEGAVVEEIPGAEVVVVFLEFFVGAMIMWDGRYMKLVFRNL
jgi:hypothetical protein